MKTSSHDRNRFTKSLLSVGGALIMMFWLANTLIAAPNGDYALKFDGVSDSVDLPAASTVLGINWQYTKTVSLWVRPTGPGPVGGIFEGDMLFGDFPRWFGIYQANFGGADRIWVVNHDNNTDGDGEDYIGITYTPGEWVHITLVHTTNILYAYKNGVLVGSATTGPTAAGHPGAIGGIQLRIGGAIGASWNVLSDDEIDEVKIWSAARSAQEIRRDMYRTLSGTEPGLRAYYRMSNGTGTTLTDNGSYGFHGILRDGGLSVPPDGNTAAWVTSGVFTGPRMALDFDGVNDYVDVGSDAATVIGGSWAGTKSAEIWARPSAAGIGAATAVQGNLIIGGGQWGISQANIGGEDRLWLWNNDGDEDRIGLPYTVGEWTHLALVHNGGVLTVYQDGRVAGSISSANTSGDTALTIGGRSGGNYFQGQLDELRLWNTARTASQILANAYQTVSGESGLAAYYRFDQQNEVGQTEVVDSSGNDHHATMTNMSPNADWVLSTAFNTWIGGESPNWAAGVNWSRYAATNTRLGITRYPHSNAATVTAPTTILDAVLSPDADLVVDSALTVTNRLLGPGDVTVNGSLFNLGRMEVATVTIASGALMEVQNGGILTVTGVLENNGTLRQTQPVSGVVSFHTAGVYGGVQIDSSGQNLGNTVVSIRGNQNCTSIPDETVRRCFDIAPELSPTTGVSITFAFTDSEIPMGMDCNTLNVYHWNGSGWDSLATTGHDCAGSLNFVTAVNVTNFSPFVLRSLNSPTAVTLTSLSVHGNAGWLAIIFPLLFLLLLTGVALWWCIRWREKAVG